MEKYLKLPCNIEEDHISLLSNVNKDDIIAIVKENEAISNNKFTDKPELLEDINFLALSMAMDIKNNTIYSSLKPESTPLIWDDKIIEQLNGTPLYYIVTSYKENLVNIVKSSIQNCNDLEQFQKIFSLLHSIVYVKGISCLINNVNTLVFVPLLNYIKISFSNEKSNTYIVHENNQFVLKAKYNLKKGDVLTYTPPLSPIPEINFLKFGVLPNNIEDMEVNFSFEDNEIILSKNMTKENKLVIRRIRKNPKYKELKKKLKEIYDSNLKLLSRSDNDNNDNHFKAYIKHIRSLYEDNYPK
jgi:hypothetical protein